MSTKCPHSPSMEGSSKDRDPKAESIEDLRWCSVDAVLFMEDRLLEC